MAAEPAILRDAFGQDETTNANPFQDQSRFPHRTVHIAHGLGRIHCCASSIDVGVDNSVESLPNFSKMC